MKNRFFRIALAATMILSTGTLVTSCSVEDGVDGINGVDGANGLNGADGQDGVDGQNGADGADGQDGMDGQDGTDGQDGADGQDALGHDELTKYGSIKAYLSGLNPNGVMFNDSTEFRYITHDHYDNEFFQGEGIVEFKMERFLVIPDEVGGLEIDFSIDDLSSPNPTLHNFRLRYDDYLLVFDDLTVIDVNDGLFDFGGEYGDHDIQENLVITDFSFDDATNHLMFKYDFSGDYDLGWGLQTFGISGEVDVIVFETINLDDND